MAHVIDNRALLIEVISATSKNGKPFRMAKMLLSGTSAVLTAFISDDAPALPAPSSYFACQLPLALDRDGKPSVVINKDAKFAKAE